MTIEQFRTALKTRPFKPFKVHVADQHVIEIRHPELALMTEGGRTVYINTAGENMEIIDLLLVTRLTFSENGSTPRRGKRPRRK